MKTPEEIKKRLERCEDTTHCNTCESSFYCKVEEDALTYIQQLEAQLEQVTRERDAAVRDAHGVCRACIHYNGHYPTGDIMSCCKFEECVHGADDWESEDSWQWRGVEVE